MRIVSLISSATEILCRLGLKDNIVGISHECDYPPDLKRLPVLSEPVIDPKRRGADVHRQIQELVRDGLSIYHVKTDILEQLEPDIIVTQDQCEVCAVSLKDVQDAVCKLTKTPARIVSLRPHVLDDIVGDFFRVGEATGRVAEAEKLKEEFWIKLNSVNARAGALKGRPKIACIEWIDPPVIAGGWIPEIVRLAGGEPTIVSTPESFKMISWSEVHAADPDVVAIFPCGYPIDKSKEELKGSKAARELKKLRAYKDGRVFICDGNAYLSRPGPRIAESCEILASLIHPDTFGDLRQKHSESIERF